MEHTVDGIVTRLRDLLDHSYLPWLAREVTLTRTLSRKVASLVAAKVSFSASAVRCIDMSSMQMTMRVLSMSRLVNPSLVLLGLSPRRFVS